jgi:hypothetical protein
MKRPAEPALGRFNCRRSEINSRDVAEVRERGAEPSCPTPEVDNAKSAILVDRHREVFRGPTHPIASLQLKGVRSEKA